VEAIAVRDDFGATADGVDGDLIAAFNGEDGFQFGFEEAPVAGFGTGMQMVMLHDGF
jgi:hypothetical protein